MPANLADVLRNQLDKTIDSFSYPPAIPDDMDHIISLQKVRGKRLLLKPVELIVTAPGPGSGKLAT